MFSVINKLRSNFSSLYEVVVFMDILIFATFLPLYLKFMPLNSFLDYITPSEKIQTDESTELKKARLIKFTDYILSREILIYKKSCLKRSIILYRFLTRLGLDLRINFGVRYQNEAGNSKKFIGHSWLVKNGKPYLENSSVETDKYKVTYSYP